MKVPYPAKIDLSEFRGGLSKPRALYGLPEKVEFCKKCVISNQRPNSAVEFKNSGRDPKPTIRFLDGICDACRFAEKKENEIDWKEREAALLELCNKYRSNNGSYDCLVPGSGGKDSFFASHILKTKYKMHPLTVTWAPHIYTPWGSKNFQSWIHAGHDNYLMTPNGRVHRLLTRLATDNLLHPFQPFMLGQKMLAPRMAKAFGIPLVFFGENEAEYGNPIADTEIAVRNSKYFTLSSSDEEIYLGGVTVNDLVNVFGLDLNDLAPYIPMQYSVAESIDLQVHYLGYYLKWHPQSCYYYAVEHGNFVASPERTPGTYSKYNSIDDKIDDLHYYTTGAKFGLGRASYDASQEIRSGDISRDEGISLVSQFDHEYPARFEAELFDYLSITPEEFPRSSARFEAPRMSKDYFRSLVDSFRSPHLWKLENGNWQLRDPIKRHA